ncbi:exo-beta-N-acetylmuramidase NamZ family protein [Cellulosimicrobium marinum]|uniref:exo-beta-N-acetylmuramidase NamZ family protein n=1 Tax=Cellulosimicrobium marinum TaxID=1638992 RepID=UPI001E5F53F3|nr:DUF1343 domain-containing protein [Cellulosimicrobium marinum]MCB7137129.1 DUF1343 domain-containing protein [Cellulosimicrobium marinum]
MRFGIDRLVAGTATEADDLLRHGRLGLLTHDLATTVDLEVSRVALRRAGVPVVRYLSPEHGLSGRAREGEHVATGVEPASGLPVVSLYGDHVRPDADDLHGLDAVVVDLQDVGARFYTYVWTLSHVLEACAEHGVAVVVLDRPNPLGGRAADVEGPVLDEACHSLVGRWAMPLRHGLTIGELARHWVRTRGIDVDLRVVAADGWTRDVVAAGDPTWPWVPPSPNMPSTTTALLYPGTCLAEGVNLAEGRSTAVPFRVVGAPWLDGAALADAVNGAGLPGVRAVPYGFTPLVRDWAGEACEGVLLHVTDVDAVRPVRTGLALLRAVDHVAPGRLAETPQRGLQPGESDATPLERLLGRRDALARVLAGEWDAPGALDVPGWQDATADDLLYG